MSSIIIIIVSGIVSIGKLVVWGRGSIVTVARYRIGFVILDIVGIEFIIFLIVIVIGVGIVCNGWIFLRGEDKDRRRRGYKRRVG